MREQNARGAHRSMPVIFGFVLSGATLFLGLGLGWKLHAPTNIVDAQAVRSAVEYKFINPLLTCNISENKEFDEYKPLEAQINRLLTQPYARGVTASIYYRDLNSGRWFGVNDDDTYSPASLMKVPLMIAYLKREESNPGILQASLEYADQGDYNSVEHYKPSTKKLILGRFYTIEELVQVMIEGSDNNAASLLFDYLNQDSLHDAFSDLGLKSLLATSTTDTSDVISVKAFSYIFRVLYNSTYLSRELSEKALQYLSYADFPEGIIGGIPRGVTVAQKFGERTILTPGGKVIRHELHDCGIVYYPNHPYLLCVMTKGGEFDALASAIRNVSALIYGEVDKEYSTAH